MPLPRRGDCQAEPMDRLGGQTTAGSVARQPAAIGRGFDFTANMRRLCEDVVERLPEMGHIQLQRVAFSFAQARKRVSHGLQATLTPMRFEGGATTSRQHGQTYAVQRLYGEQGQEMYYILTFYLPRFLETDFNEKLVTLFHELWHISPECNGDLRRHPGRCYAHTHSEKEYDALMQVFVDRWLALDPPEARYAFLRSSFEQLRREHGRVLGTRIPHPKLIPLAPHEHS